MAASAVTAQPADVMMENQDGNQADLPRPYKCPMCDKAFHRLEHQTRHIRTHTGEKPHACQFPGCSKRFSRSDELTRHSRIHNNPNSRRASNKQPTPTAQAAAAAIQGGMYDNAAFQHVQASGQMSTTNQMNGMNGANGGHAMNGMNQMHQINQVFQPPQQNQPTYYNGQSTNVKQDVQRSPVYQTQSMGPPPISQASQSAPNSQHNSPNVSPPNSYATYSSNPGSYVTRNISGDISPAQGFSHQPMNINLLATAASQVERENNNASHIPNAHLSLPPQQYYHHNSPYHVGRMPSLSSYHYSSNPTSQPMSRSQSDEDQRGTAKRSKPGSPQSTAPPSPEYPHESTSPTPDHTPLATPSHSPRLRPQFYNNGVHLPLVNHLTIRNQPPPALAPVEPSADGHQPSYVPHQHTGLRISEIMEAGDGAARKLPVPMVAAKEGGYARINDLVNPDSGQNSGGASEDGIDSESYERMN